MSDFAPGFAARHHNVGDALQRAFAVPGSFAPRDIGAAMRRPYEAESAAPRHFEPAERDGRGPTDFDPEPRASHEFIDPIAAARAAGYEEGLAAARDEAEALARRETALLDQVSDALTQGAHFDRERMAGHLRQTVLHLVTRMIGEAGVAPDVLAARIETAVDMLADSAESALLRLHPDDVALVEGKLPKTVFAVADAHVARGGFVIESASTIVEDGPDLWLEQLAAAIDRVPIPPLC